MALSDKDKERVKQEEKYRQKVREEQEYRSGLQSGLKNNKKSTHWGLWVFLIFLIGSIVPFLVAKPSNNEDYVDNIEFGTNPGNINVSRQTLVGVLGEHEYEFHKEDKIEGQDNYVSTKDKGEVQLLGEADNLNSASFTAYMGFDEDGTVNSSVTAQTEMVVFSSGIDRVCTDWVVKHQMEAISDTKVIYKKTENYCGRELTLFYFPGDSMTLGVAPAKQ